MNFSLGKTVNIRAYIYLLLALVLSLLIVILLFYKAQSDDTRKMEDELIHYHLKSIRLISEIKQFLNHIDEYISRFSSPSSWTKRYKGLSPYLNEIGKEVGAINQLQEQYPKAEFASLSVRLKQQYDHLHAILSPKSAYPMTIRRSQEAVEQFNIVLTQFQLLHMDRRSTMMSQLDMERQQSLVKILLFPTFMIIAGGFLFFRILGKISTGLRRENEMKKTLVEQATKDPLTGLYNRRYLSSRLKEEMARAGRQRQTMALLLCDLDQFKAINDNHGHQMGDVALKAVANILLDSIRGADYAFRWGGDEFIALLHDTNRDGFLIVAERIRKGIAEIRDKDLSKMGISIGAAIYPEHGTHPDELIRMADRALYIAKKGGGKIHIGEEEYRLDDDSINVVFQPVMDVRLNQILGYEALSRDPSGKQSILQLFRKYHAIGKLHEFKRLCFNKQLKMAQELGLEFLFVNVDFKVLKKLDIPPKLPNMEVVLEISEEEVLDNVEDALKVAQKWKNHGYKFAMDDFGAGFISLPFIARLTPDYIKLDRSTILQAVSSTEFRMVLEDLINGLRKVSTDGIIAEGIETEKELSIMKELGIYLIQGNLFGKPEAL